LQQLAEGANTNVIVILRDQVVGVPPARGNMLARAAALSSAQTPIVTELRQARASRIRTFGLINVARLDTHAALQLPTSPNCAGAVLPGGCALTSVAPETTAVGFLAQANESINMDVF
jgi:hypothetical protein